MSKDISYAQQRYHLASIVKLLPDDLFSSLSSSTSIDHYSKVLYGQRLFNLLLYAQLNTTGEYSQRRLEDIFSSSSFQKLFDYPSSLHIRHSSISSRLSSIDISFFKEAYELILENYNHLYTTDQDSVHHLIRVDSTLVSETCNKLVSSMKIAGRLRKYHPSSQKKGVKYTMCLDECKPVFSKVYFENSDLNEDLTFLDVIKNYVALHGKEHPLFVFDRGLKGKSAYQTLNKEGIHFIGRLRHNRKLKVVRDICIKDCNSQNATLKVVSDQLVQIYAENKQLQEPVYRVIKVERKEVAPPKSSPGRKQEKDLYFITDMWEAAPLDIAAAYKKRWDIEVFFRFIKQELNFSHFLCVNPNGIQVLMYMTLISSLLVLIYKKLNDIGYKTAKRRLAMELQNCILEMAEQQGRNRAAEENQTNKTDTINTN